MVTRAVLRYLRITPRKFRLIVPLVKGKRPEEAIAILTGVKKNASKYGIDLINSALNNVKRMQGVETADLYISNFIVNGGPMLKRFRAASMGRASLIKKRTSHVTIELDRIPAKEKAEKTPATKEAPKAKGLSKKEAAKDKHPEGAARKKATTKKGKE
ncbi:MAG: 50S ribosomal protein L22 [Candidatus Omnitrophica bacterium]|nr:50S ribosomal protein L22 [Candidatus Omnitrophota bacterium]